MMIRITGVGVLYSSRSVSSLTIRHNRRSRAVIRRECRAIHRIAVTIRSSGGSRCRLVIRLAPDDFFGI